MPSIMCYMTPPFEFFWPTTDNFQTRIQDLPIYHNKIDASVQQYI